MKRWLQQHQQALQLVLARVSRHLLATLTICCVMGVTLSLPSILYVVVDNLNQLAGNIENKPQISLFLKLDIKADGIAAVEKQLQQELKQQSPIKSYHFVGKEEAWQQLQKESGLDDTTTSLAKNPLPDAYFVQLKSIDPLIIDSLQKAMQQWPGVELAQVDANWVKRLYSLLELGKKAILVLVFLLGFALMTIIGNTIRLQILTQREEIEVSKLIGATNGFIRRPFLYVAVLYGLGAGLIAWLLLAGVITLFNYSVADIAALYASNFSLALPGWQVIACILASAISLSWLGAYMAVGRSLARFE